MNWFESPLSFNTRFEPKHTAQMFLQNNFQLDPLVNSLPQNMPRLSVPYTNAMNHIAHDLLAGPTKRVRHTQNNFTQITPKIEDIARLSQEQKRIAVESPEAPVIVLHKANESDLVIPPLSGLNGLNFSHQRRPENMIPHQQNVWQQMQRQQQNFEKFMQHQIAQQIEHQKLELNQMMYRIHEAYRMQATVPQERSFANLPELQMNHFQAQRLLNSQKLVELGESSLNVKNLKAEISPENSTEFKGLDEEDYQYVKLEEMKERASDKSTEGGSRRSSAKTEEDKAKICQMVTKTVTKEQPKKRKNQNSSAKYFNIFEENLVKKNREGPRGKNKWQKITAGPEDEQPEQVEQPVVKMVEEPVEIPQTIQKVKPEKVPEIPQYLQDDSLIDYQGMLATMVTDDPMYVGDENKGFVVIKKVVRTTNDDGEDTIINESRVGDRYQTAIPELRQKGEKVAKGRKRCPELVWKAGAIHENEMKRYYDDICKILKCDNVNEERALKLLKRKNFKKEKVKVNITKNEKFYSSFLVVTENMGNEISDNTSQ